MNIWMLHPRLERRGGAENLIRSLCHGLVDRGHQVSVATLRFDEAAWPAGAWERVEVRTLADWNLLRGTSGGVQTLSACDYLYVPESQNQFLEAIRAALDGLPVLTIGESSDFAIAGGMIGFVREGARLRYQINQDAIATAGLRLETVVLQHGELIGPPGGRR